jgi:tRNA G46 methylase TrmB
LWANPRGAYRVLPKKGIALEIGSGTGEHVICFAKALPGLVWLPSDPDSASRASIKAWSATEGLANVRVPVAEGCGAWRTTHHLTR